MDPDKYQLAWQTDSDATRVTFDANALLNKVQSNQRDFLATILRRDVIEVGVGALLLPYWIYQGLTSSLPWTWWLTVPAIIWVVGFFLVDRMRYPQKASDPGEPLLKCVNNSLTQIEHQIWLLRNVFWWYLLPFTISILAFFAHATLLASKDWSEALSRGGVLFGFLLALYSFIDYINQRAIRSDLEPRRQKLFTLCAGLSGDGLADESTTSGAKTYKSSSVLRRWLIVAVVSFVIFVVMGIFFGIGKADTSFDGPPRTSGPGGEALARLIVDQRKEKNLVGLAAMVMVDGQLQAAAAHGQRKIGSGVSLELTDEWHLGGITKSMTATMIARLVESGRMKWSDTVGQIFPEASIHEDWKRITLKQLLTDTAGAPKNFPKAIWYKRPALGPECTEARLEAVLEVLAQKPEPSPDEKYVYSNVGYTIVGAMAEKVTGATWEDLVKQEIFEPLKLTSAGFGPPASPDETLQQPRGHHVSRSWKVPADDDEDNTPIMGPSGTVRMTLRDLSTYATDHLRGDLGGGKLLSAETYKLLHAPDFNYYAYGWIKKEPVEEIPYTTVYWHNGSNTLWYALVVFVPEKNMVVAVTSNDGDFMKAQAAAWEIVKASVQQFSAEADPPTNDRTSNGSPTTERSKVSRPLQGGVP